VNVLVVAAHPDDEVLGAGGTIARLTAGGSAVNILILGEGVTSRAQDPATESDSLAHLHAASRAAADVLGASSLELAGLPDNRFDSIDLLDIVKLVESAIDGTRPELVLTQHGGDVNIDHHLTFRAVLAATRPVPDHPVRSVLAFEVGSSTEWAFGTLTPAFRPQVFFDISATLETKMRALDAYGAELRPFPHPRSPESVEAQARRWGSGVGVAAAEAFQVIREVR